MDYNSSKNQDIKSKLVNSEVNENVNELIQFLLSNYEHDYTEEVMNVAQTPNYESACEYHLDSLDNSELIEIATELNLVDADKKEGCKYLNKSIVKEEILKGGCDKDNYTSILHVLTSNLLLDQDKNILDRNSLISDIMQDEDFDYQDFSNDNNLDYDYYEAYEFWSVTPFLADKLSERGEMVEDIMGFTVWGRRTTGQAILLDHVISLIAEDMKILEGQAYERKS